MKQLRVWVDEQMKDKKFRILLITAAVILTVISVECYLFKYTIFKGARYVILLATLFFLSWIDHKSMRIPNNILLSLLTIRILILALEWLAFPNLGLSILISSAMGALIGGGMFLLAYLLSRGGMGAGDVKLFATIGWMVGNGAVVTIAFLTVICAAFYSIAMLIQKKTTLKEKMPFAPFVLVGTILAMALGV